MFKKLLIRFLEGHSLLRKWKTNTLELRNFITHNKSGSEDTDKKVEKDLWIPWNSEQDALMILRLMKDAHMKTY